MHSALHGRRTGICPEYPRAVQTGPVLPWSAMPSVGPIRPPVTIHEASASLGRVAVLGSFPERARRQLKAFHTNPRRGPPALQPHTLPPPLAGQWLAVPTHPSRRLPMCTVASASPQPLSLISPSWFGEASARLPSYSRFIYIRMRAGTGGHEDTVTPHAEHRLTQGGAAAKLPYSAPPFSHARPVK